MENSKQIKYGAIISYLQIAVGAIITLIYTPFIIRVLGKSEYGLYNTVASVVASLSILSLGFGSGYVRFYSRYKAEGKKEEIARLNGMFMTIFSIIGCVALMCGLFLSHHLELVFDEGLTELELVTAKRLMTLLSINLALSFPFSVFTSIITANEKFIFQKCVLLFKQVASPLVCIPLLLMGFASTGMVISMVIIYIIMDIVNACFCIRKLKSKFVFGHFDKQLFKELAFYSGFIAVNMIVDQVNLNIDKFLLGRYRGTASVAVYSAGYTLYHYYMTFSTSVSNVFIPRVHHIWSNINQTVEEKNKQLSEVFSFVGRIQFTILLLVCSGLVLFGRQFIARWAGEDYGNAYFVVLLLAISAITPLSQNVGIEIQRAKNKHQFRSILYAAMAIINLILSIFLCQIYGEIGSAFGTAMSFILANTIAMNLYYYKALGINIRLYWNTCIRALFSAVPAFLIGFGLIKFLDTFKWRYMILGIVIYTIVYIACEFFLALSKDEKHSITNYAKKIFLKKKKAMKR